MVAVYHELGPTYPGMAKTLLLCMVPFYTRILTVPHRPTLPNHAFREIPDFPSHLSDSDLILNMCLHWPNTTLPPQKAFYDKPTSVFLTDTYLDIGLEAPNSNSLRTQGRRMEQASSASLTAPKRTHAFVS